MNILSIQIDGLRTVSESNSREHWSVRNKRKREQQRSVYYAWKKTLFGRRVPKPPCVVTFTRFGPRMLDAGDNLPSAFKGIRDTVAQLLNVDDGNEQMIRFEYKQQHDSDYGIAIQVESAR